MMIKPAPISSLRWTTSLSGRPLTRWASATLTPSSLTLSTCWSRKCWACCMASSSSCSSISRGRDVIGLGKGLCTAVGNTYATCNSELVLWAISAAVVSARLASLEPSVASRIFVGNMLISSLLLDRFPYLLDYRLSQVYYLSHAEPLRASSPRTPSAYCKRGERSVSTSPLHTIRSPVRSGCSSVLLLHTPFTILAAISVLDIYRMNVPDIAL